jgi:N-acetylglucosamine-6-phosphate deacetylase
MIAIETEHLFDGEASLGPRTVLVESGVVIDILDRPPPGMTVQRLGREAILAPGFVDLQVNGGGGVLFNDAPTPDGLRRIAAAHLQLGTTSFLATVVSGGRALRASALAAVRTAMDAIPSLRGIHVDGPFIARARRGIHPEQALEPMTDVDLAGLAVGYPAALLLTLAPEIVPPQYISALVAAGVTVFAGHTDGECETVQAAFAAGARGATHLFNAMSQFGSRAPGAVGAVLDHATAYAGIIADGHHVHPAAIRVAWRALGAARLFLVSDAMPSVGADDPAFSLAGRRITLTDGRLTDEYGTLAGAHLSMAEAVRFVVHRVGIPLADALRMATATPADCIHLRGRGRIAGGAQADLVALDPDLRVAAVWQDGERVV